MSEHRRRVERPLRSPEVGVTPARPRKMGLVVAAWVGWTLLLNPSAWAQRPVEPAPARLSGLDFVSESTRSMQRDDAQNPGMLWVREGQALWNQPGPDGKPSCANCHGATPAERMRGVATRYPAWHDASSSAVTLSQRVDLCRQQKQGMPAQGPEGRERLALTATLAHASRGQALSPPQSAAMDAVRSQGERLWRTRMGQLGLSCADCHDAHAGQRLGGSPIPPGNGVGYPTYRLEWQALGSLQRRLRNCMTGVRAQPWPPDSPEATALAVFMAWRDRSLPLEAPAVRP